MVDKIRYPEVNSPKGTFIWPQFSEPDKKYRRYGSKLAFAADTQEAKDFIAQIDAQYEASRAPAIEALKETIAKNGKTKKLETTLGLDTTKLPAIEPKMAPKPYTMELDDQGNETGRILISSTMKDSYKKKTGEMVQLTPRLFDAAGKVLDHKKVNVRGGSEGRIRMELRPYFVPAAAGAGVSLAFRGAQITKLSSGGRDAASMGFGVEEDGYAYVEEVAQSAGPAGDATIAGAGTAGAGDF